MFRVMRAIVILLSSIALFVWVYGISRAIDSAQLSGESLRPLHIYYLAFPVLYLAFLLLSCSRWFRIRTVVIGGIILHLGLVSWVVVIWIWTKPLGQLGTFFTVQGALISTVAIILWVLLLRGRMIAEPSIGPEGSRAIKLV